MLRVFTATARTISSVCRSVYPAATNASPPSRDGCPRVATIARVNAASAASRASGISASSRMASVTAVGTFEAVSARVLCAATQYEQPSSRLMVRNTVSCSAGVSPDAARKAPYPAR